MIFGLLLSCSCFYFCKKVGARERSDSFYQSNQDNQNNQNDDCRCLEGEWNFEINCDNCDNNDND